MLCNDGTNIINRYFIIFVAVLMAVFSVESVVLYLEGRRRKGLLILEDDSTSSTKTFLYSSEQTLRVPGS